MKKEIFIIAAAISLSACDVVSMVHFTQSRAVMTCGDGTTVQHVPGTDIYTYSDKSSFGDLDKGITPEQFCKFANNKTLKIDK